jgi:protein TonB
MTAGMAEPVTAILLERARDSVGLKKMFTISLVAHAVGLIALLAMEQLGSVREDVPETVMTVSLGGAPGPRAGGMTPMGGRPVPATPPPAEPPAPPRREAARAPEAKAPDMTLPSQRERIRKPEPPRAATTPTTRGRAPSTPSEPAQPGSAVAETGARGMGFGLTTGGGGAGGYLDVGDFCCPEYLTTMIQLVQRNWNSRQQIGASNMVKFTILRDGSLSGVELEQSSGYAALDLASQRALIVTRQLPPLPAAFPNDHLTVHLRFQYQP